MRTGSAAATLCTLALLAGAAHAEQAVRTWGPHSDRDRRAVHALELLEAALEVSVAGYGPYRLEISVPGMARRRALVELQAGKLVNVLAAPTRTEWEETLIPVRIPLRKGLLSYRLLLVDRAQLDLFSGIASVEELKRLRAGLRSGWSTTAAMEALGFTVVVGASYEGLFRMLMSERFDYFPRGINEIFPELDSRRGEFPDMVIEPTLALHLPLPQYFFVTPGEPALARRLEAGLRALIENGAFDALFQRHYADAIAMAGLAGRRVLRVRNPHLSPQTPDPDGPLWFRP